MSDHYQTLGVERTSTPDEIKKAYRKLASKHHPDKGGDTAMFQRIEEAYRVLSDPNQRQQYDNPQQHNPFGGAGFPGGFSFNFGGHPFDDIFRQFQQQQRQSATKLYTITIPISLELAAKGGKHHVTMNVNGHAKPVEIEIPRAVEHGQQLRYNGIMDDGLVQINFEIIPHHRFERRGLDIYENYSISIWDLILGKTVELTDIYGNELVVNIPPKTRPNATMRLAGRGISLNGRTGNHFLLLSPVIPAIISEQLLELIEKERNNK